MGERHGVDFSCPRDLHHLNAVALKRQAGLDEELAQAQRPLHDRVTSRPLRGFADGDGDARAARRFGALCDERDALRIKSAHLELEARVNAIANEGIGRQFACLRERQPLDGNAPRLNEEDAPIRADFRVAGDDLLARNVIRKAPRCDEAREA